jgi:hypothetical protein
MSLRCGNMRWLAGPEGIPANSSELTKRGSAGWELVGIYAGLMTGSDVPLAIFKRKKA